jgi:hypothetical protein
MSTREKVARWLAEFCGDRAYDNLQPHRRIDYDDAADDLLRVIYAGGDAA